MQLFQAARLAPLTADQHSHVAKLAEQIELSLAKSKDELKAE